MSRLGFFRQWVRFLKTARCWTDLAGVVLVLFLFFAQAPRDIWNSEPATGGDMGSHFFPLVTLVEYGLPNGHVRVWNPGNLGGEPHLTHYFPLPYLFMAFLSLFMPLGRAFNIGTWFPLAIFPVCVYFCFRGLKTKFPGPLLAMLASLSYLYNESFSMWGGNTLSTLAGQFAHVYAFDFFLLGIGSLAANLGSKKFPFMAMFFFSGVLLSHFYIALFLPVVFLVFLFLGSREDVLIRFKVLAAVGVGALALAAWFVIPMIHNAQWNTAFGLVWESDKFLQEAFPTVFWPLTGLSILLLMLWIFSILRPEKDQLREREWRVTVPLFFLLISCSVVYYFAFPGLGLVDVRVIPTMQFSICVLAAIFASLLLRRAMPAPWVWFWTVPLSLVLVWWAVRGVQNFPFWLHWNYSSWEAKSAYPELKKLTADLRGDFSQGRVVYENSDLSNAAGTVRVFEMLPYFSGRATLESVYMQATILAPEAFYLQALISKTPSCPFPNFECTSFDVDRSVPYLKLLGVQDLILISPEVRFQAEASDAFERKQDYGNWHHYQVRFPAHLVETLSREPKFLSKKDYKQSFYSWFLQYTEKASFQIVAGDKDQSKIKQSIQPSKTCHPELRADFDRLDLRTDCPGVFHYLKFAFHSTWETSTGDPLYLTSPGFIGLIPSQPHVTLTWGRHWLWTMSNGISWLSLVVVVGFLLRSLRKKQA